MYPAVQARPVDGGVLGDADGVVLGDVDGRALGDADGGVLGDVDGGVLGGVPPTPLMMASMIPCWVTVAAPRSKSPYPYCPL